VGVAGRLFQTCGIDALPLAEQSAIREKVENGTHWKLRTDPDAQFNMRTAR
jgi:hypothetical protein